MRESVFGHVGTISFLSGIAPSFLDRFTSTCERALSFLSKIHSGLGIVRRIEYTSALVACIPDSAQRRLIYPIGRRESIAFAEL